MRFLFVILLLSMLSCKKSNINDHPNFVGNWRASQNDATYDLVVKQNGSAVYEKIKGNTTTSANGRLIVKDDDKVKIGIVNFSLNEYPNQPNDTANWTMTMDDVKYFRY